MNMFNLIVSSIMDSSSELWKIKPKKIGKSKKHRKKSAKNYGKDKK